MKKKLVRLLICIGITLAIFLFCQIIQAGVLGSISLAGTLLYFLAYDTFEGDKKLFRALRIGFTVAGTAIVVVVGLMAAVDYIALAGEIVDENLWLTALNGFWLLGGLTALAVFVKTSEMERAKIFRSFVVLITACGSYLFYVGCAYLGFYVNEFFYGYPGIILCFAPAIIAIVKWIRIIVAAIAEFHRENQSSRKAPPKETDDRKNADQWFFGGQLNDLAYSIKKEGNFKESNDIVEWRSVSANSYGHKISIHASVEYVPEIRRTATKEKLKTAHDDGCEILINRVKSLIEHLRTEYKNFDEDYTIEAQVDIHIRDGY